MLLGLLAASLLGSALTRRGVIRAGKRVVRGDQNFWCHLILYLILKYKNIIKINLNLMVFFQELIYLK